MKITISFEIPDRALNEGWFETRHVPEFLLRLPSAHGKAEISYESSGKQVRKTKLSLDTADED
jgi:hypothetical protein